MPEKPVYPYGKPAISGLLKYQPDEFKVTENLGFEPLGEGEHLFLWIEKSLLTTHELIERVAGDFWVKPRDIGYSGLKDKIALTRQWLSLYLPGKMTKLKIPKTSGYKILSHAWHTKKLRPGTHRSNYFDVIVRNVDALPDTSLQQLDLIRNQGMANYFGQQRFGRRDNNVEAALQAFASNRSARKLSRSKKGLYISALRSYLFNCILSRRIERGYWDKPLPGDVFILSGSRSIFYESANAALLERFTQMDLSSTISLYGIGSRLLQDDALELEDQVMAEYGAVKRCLIQQKAKLQMRATRVAVQELKLNHDPVNSTLHIELSLARGSYFTSFLDHFIDFENHRFGNSRS
jgi:tRNA pseudouridine13 synthase